ncbi:Transcription antitermination factor NusA [Pseudomonas syringae pv. actinidiae]|uniref:Transcription antitermination factor NusA n=1 Tax=Pseudomonas syringae pv. actinidiae TaxID=103796 RepID=A0AAN4TPZ5_PSESF|nr:Transcription antitermination factor NusA [Pseudomonas syringae pv. actinidiae]
MSLGAEIVRVTFIGLMHLRIAFAILVLGRTGRVNQRGIDDGALTQRQATVAQITINYAENPGRQLVLFQQTTEVENGGFVWNALQAQA